MHELDLSQKERDVLKELRLHLAQGAETEKSLRELHERARSEFEREIRNRRRELKTRVEAAIAKAKTEFEQSKKSVEGDYQRKRSQANAEEEQTRKTSNAHFEEESEKARSIHQQTRWETQAVYLASKSSEKEEFKKTEHEIREHQRELERIESQIGGWLDDRKLGNLKTSVVASTEDLFIDKPREKLAKAIADATESADAMMRIPGATFLAGPRLIFVYVIAAVISLPVAWFFAPPGRWGLIALISTIILGSAASFGVYLAVRVRVRLAYDHLKKHLSLATTYFGHVQAEAAATYRQQRGEQKKRNDHELHEADRTYRQTMLRLTEEHRRIISQCDKAYPPMLAEFDRWRDEEIKRIEAKYPPLLAKLREEFDTALADMDAQYRAQSEGLETKARREVEDFRSSWLARSREIARDVQGIATQAAELFPPWESDLWENWIAPTHIPSGISFGRFQVAVKDLVKDLPVDPDMQAALPEDFQWPALLSLPVRLSALFKGTGDALLKASAIQQNLMLRMLTSIPPGKTRFTIIDPVGLGQDFASLMHLADHDEQLVTSRIWTETSHIEQRLVDLTEHMENVIQKYLRNQYETIDAYNEEAGEVAEPYRVLVISHFPANFTEGAIRRLLSILSAGPRCGVYVFMSADTRLQLPHGVTLADMERHTVRFQYSSGDFAWNDEDFGKFPLQFEMPPSPDFTTRLLADVGQRAKAASRVEVPFRIVIPPPSEQWLADSRREIRVPLGRAGATKLQFLNLGAGTSQHVLIAGKTGSGKSTLLHAMITSTALRYSPDQVQFYLIDFKKGVEFKTYATHRLPHARVIAIESEREFGLSVMQRLDAELAIRGDRFRALGVQDVAAYREAADADPSLGPMPRILFIVDEFQEFFVADDRVSQDAALLLDRLVRQGRAFGIHVLLGSQTLGGAYSLARSTLGQMAVRIALQCSEADAHLILSEENSAARLLSRPGEAIYNDANGRVEGNNPFQIVWLPDEEREIYLKQLAKRSAETGAIPRQQIVFEGNVPADIERNEQIAAALAAGQWPMGRRSAKAILGEAIEIKDPTSVEFVDQSGSNLLLIGPQEEAAAAVLATAMATLALSVPPANAGLPGRSAKFYLLDASLADSPVHGLLAKVATSLPHPIQVLSRRELSDVLTELNDEISTRQISDDPNRPDLFLFIFDVGRVRDLRKSEDEFGFSSPSGDGAPKPDRQLATILKEGPALGIHAIVWCDGLNNLNRTFDRAAIREFEIRVLFQMSPADSSTLIDNPAASRLGPHRAYFHDEDEGRLEKFRPYGFPEADWLENVRVRLAARSVPVADNEG